jgi:hypothetical protein
MKNILLAFALLGGLTCVAGGDAKALSPFIQPASDECGTLVNKDAGLQFTVPKGWICEEADGALDISSPDKGVNLSFIVSPAKNLQKAVEAAAGELDKQLKKVEILEEGKEVKINGLPAFVMGGTGEIDGHPVAWSLGIIVGKKPLIVIAIGVPESLEKHGDELKQMMTSFKAA